MKYSKIVEASTELTQEMKDAIDNFNKILIPALEKYGSFKLGKSEMDRSNNYVIIPIISFADKFLNLSLKDASWQYNISNAHPEWLKDGAYISFDFNRAGGGHNGWSFKFLVKGNKLIPN